MAGAGENKNYKIPKGSEVRDSILSILDEAFTIRSQTLFRKLVLSRLREKYDGKIKISPKRLRRIAAHMENVDLIIHCREGKKGSKKTICPVCDSRLEDIKNSTLYGWTVPTGKFCPTCNYWFGNSERIPTRYVFTIEKERYIRDTT